LETRKDAFVSNASVPSAANVSWGWNFPPCLVHTKAQLRGSIPRSASNGSIDVFPLADDRAATGIPVVVGYFVGPDSFYRVPDCDSNLLAQSKKGRKRTDRRTS
jgi:hypothetical protein